MITKPLYSLILILSLFFGAHVRAQTLKDKLNTAYQTFINKGKLTNGLASLTVLDRKTGAVIFSNNGTVGLPTASTMKVITSITAFDILGTDYRFKTQLAYSGTIDSTGVLHGDIIITGSGDPTLGSERYPETNGETIINKWIYTIKNAGISHIQGRIIGDDRYLNGNDVPGGWNWADIGNYYGAGISGLNWRENKVGIDFTPGAVGKPARITKPLKGLDSITLVNEVTTGANGSGDNVYGYSAPYAEVIYLRGTYGKDLKKTIEIAVPDPALDLAQQLSAALASHSIPVDSLPSTGKHLQDQGTLIAVEQTVLDTHQSPTLREIVYWFNQKSINLYGEALLKTIGMISGNKNTTDQAATLLTKYWEQKLQISNGELNILDGSGLSPQNRVTTTAMAKIMNYASIRPWFSDFQKSLPTINNMSMKSGTIGGVLGYTGYHTGTSGTAVTFSLLVNNYTGGSSAMRQDMFKLLDNLK